MIGGTAPLRWRLAVDALAILTACSLLLSAWALATRFQESNRARERNAQIWHKVICDIELAVASDKTITTARKQYVIHFYDKLLVRDAGAEPCGITVTGR